MRHMRRGRVLGRSPSHRKALFANLCAALFLTERDTYEGEANIPKVKGRIVTTIEKAKEVRSMVEKCVTIAAKSVASDEAAKEFGTTAERNTEAYKAWRKSENWAKWCAARAPGVTARRRVISMIRDKQATAILFDKIAPRFVDRPGGYTRILRLAKPRLGDGGTRAILEFVGQNDRVKQKAEKPAFAESAS
jgi:large subunit ribosomal protein L17